MNFLFSFSKEMENSGLEYYLLFHDEGEPARSLFEYDKQIINVTMCDDILDAPLSPRGGRKNRGSAKKYEPRSRDLFAMTVVTFNFSLSPFFFIEAKNTCPGRFV